jgi:hypothetical protein
MFWTKAATFQRQKQKVITAAVARATRKLNGAAIDLKTPRTTEHEEELSKGKPTHFSSHHHISTTPTGAVAAASGREHHGVFPQEKAGRCPAKAITAGPEAAATAW